MNELKRQHVAAIFINLTKGLFQLAIPFAIVAFLQGILWIFFIGIAGLILLMGLFSWINWLKFRYRLEDGELYVEQGLFVKKEKVYTEEANSSNQYFCRRLTAHLWTR